MKKRLLSIGLLIIMAAALTGCGASGNFYKEGKKSFSAGDYDKAARNFSEAIAANPNRADYYIDYGMALIALEQYEDALAQFDLAYMDKDMLIVRENNKRILRGRGIAYYRMLQYDKAVEEFKLALKINVLTDLDMDILYYMADSLFAMGSYGKAAKAYTSILKLDTKAALAYNKRANCYQCLGEFDKSLVDYEKAIKLEPDNYEFYFNKYFLMLREKGAEADKILQAAENIKAKTDEDQYNVAKLHFFEGDYDNALTELSTSYEAGFEEANYYVGEIYRIRKNYSKAAYYYKIYLDSKTVNTPNGYNQLAVCLMKTDQTEEALKYLEKGLAYHDARTMQVLYRNEIIAYEKLSNYEDAGKKMTDYLTNYPKDTEAAREAQFIKTRIIAVASQTQSE